jgi:Spy/CpxP family protein refolding chaperone
MKKTSGILILGLAVAAGGAAVGLSAEGREGGDRAARRAEWLAKELNLTEEQKASWRAMHEQHLSEMQPLRDEGRALHEKLRAALQAERPDPQVVGEATIALQQHRQVVEAARKAYHEKLAKELTPEQRTKFDALAESHRMKHRGPGGFGRRGPGHGPAPEAEAPANPKS